MPIHGPVLVKLHCYQVIMLLDLGLRCNVIHLMPFFFFKGSGPEMKTFVLSEFKSRNFKVNQVIYDVIVYLTDWIRQDVLDKYNRVSSA